MRMALTFQFAMVATYLSRRTVHMIRELYCHSLTMIVICIFSDVGGSILGKNLHAMNVIPPFQSIGLADVLLLVLHRSHRWPAVLRTWRDVL